MERSRFTSLQVLAWRDGGWEKDSEIIEDKEEKEFLVCSSNEDGDNILILGTPMEQEDALITCQVKKTLRQNLHLIDLNNSPHFLDY